MRELLTIFIAALPISELRGSLPLAIFVWHIKPVYAYFLSVFGNFLPVIPLLLFWHYLIHKLSARFAFVRKSSCWLFQYTQKRHKKSFELFKELALLIFVAIPLPFTGVWSGTIAAFVFGIPFWKSVLMLGLGILLAGLMVLASLGLLFL